LIFKHLHPFHRAKTFFCSFSNTTARENVHGASLTFGIAGVKSVKHYINGGVF